MKPLLKIRLRNLSNHFALIQREFMLELKRGGRTYVQTEMVELACEQALCLFPARPKACSEAMVEFNALPFPSLKKLKIWSLHVVVAQGR